MIKYALSCSEGHAFEAWFRSSDAYDRQSRRKLVSCPQCGSSSVDKQPMAPAVVTRGRVAPEASAGTAGATTSPPVPPVELLRAFKQLVINNTEDVGSRFAQEALRMHHGETETRPIRGAATAEDAVALQSEGVEFGVLPILPEEHN